MNATRIILGTTLLVGAGFVAPARPALATQARDLIRPILLPVLWKGLEGARRHGTPEEYADRGRLLMRLIPDWIDGHVHIAGQLAFEASLAHANDPRAAADRLLAGLDYLSRVRADCTDPAAREELLKNQARFLYVRCHQDPRLARAVQERTGRSPTEMVSGLLRSIPRLAESNVLQTELCFTLIEGMTLDARLGAPVSRLLTSIEQAKALLPAVRDQELATKVRASLQNLRNYLTRPDDILLEEIRKDPYLRDLAEVLSPRRK